MRRIHLPKIGAVVAICALLGAVAGIAGSAAAPSKKAKKAQSTRSAAPRFHPGPGPGGPGVHSESVVLDKAGDGFITVTADGGTLKSISGNDLTIDESVNDVHYKDATVTVPDDATVIRNHDEAKLSDLKEGDHVRVISSSEQTVVLAEDDAWLAQERRRFGRRGPGMHGPPPMGDPGAMPPVN